MRQTRALLIINPISGTANKRGVDIYVRERLASLGMQLDVAWTAGHGDATKLAQQAVSEEYHAVIAAGGDGTINEAAAALCNSDTILGIIPCGSGNGLARHLGIPVDIKGAVDVLMRMNYVACDYGSVNERPFFCTFGIGFDAAVSEKFAREKRRGKLMYIKNTIREYVNYQPETYVISANGQVITERAFLVAVCNASQYGNNAYIAPYASITDGLLDFTVVHYGNILTTALVGVDLMTGLIDKNMLIHTFRTDEATIERVSDNAIHIDGEPLMMDRRMDIRCHKGCLKVFVPENDAPFRPVITPVRSMLNDLRYTLGRLVKK